MGVLWSATALILGHHRVRKSFLIGDAGPGEEIWVPVIAVALFDGVHKVLVDTGHHSTSWVSRHLAPATCTPEEHLLQALEDGPGWLPDEIDVVINTHLHFDHCGNNFHFPNASFVVHQREWASAAAPPPCQKELYLPSLFGPASVDPQRWLFVAGELSLLEGLRLIETPGHTAGHISVLADTAEGVLCVAGDICGTIRNLNENIVGSTVYSVEHTKMSYRKVRLYADYVIPGHEASISPFQTGGFPLVQKQLS